jgi:predicted nucleic acid-binding Zn ribbon protein
MTDYLACPNCGAPITNGEFCNLTCRRERLENNNAKREERRARIQTLLKKFIVSQPEPMVDFLGD